MVDAGRRATPVAALARAGFAEPAAALRRLHELGLDPDGPVTAALADAADPDLAVAALARLLEAAEAAGERAGLLAGLRGDGRLRRRVVGVLGASAALGDHLQRHPAHWRVLAGELRAPGAGDVAARLLGAVRERPPAVAADALRVAYRRELLAVAAGDVTGALTLDDVAARLSALADAVLGAAFAVAVRQLPPGPAVPTLAVIGMGKCGGRELNYASDVDVLFVAEAASPAATALARAVVRLCSDTTAEGVVWPVDVALRPEGKDGPLVRTLEGYLAYYRRWAHTWEFQALLKARPVAGDEALGAAFAAAVEPLVWAAAERPAFVDDVQAMRRRVVARLPAAAAERELKLGPGGLRDVEFAVQLLQLVHGRADPSVRSPTTLVALQQLAAGGYVGREDARRLAAAYRFLRTAEHRLQLQRLRRTHTLPADAANRRWLARALGLRADPVAELERVHAEHALVVRRLHEQLFYRPLLTAVARLPAADLRLTPDAARSRLHALGFADPAAALGHLQALTSGVSRRAAIQRTLLPVMLGWLADAGDPDAGLLGYRRVCDALGASPWYLALLREGGVAAQRLARLLATATFVSDLLLRAPAAVTLLGDDAALRPRAADAVRAELLATVARHQQPDEAITAARALRRAELVRIACADLLGLASVPEVGAALSGVAAATLAGAVSAAARAQEASSGASVRLAVIGMGRLGGEEQGYGSDADVLFVAAGPADVAAATAVAREAQRLLALPAPDPPLLADPDLRPEGRNGPLVRSLAGYVEYYRRWAAPWEPQALLRARAVAGDPQLGAAFEGAIAAVRYPVAGPGRAAEREIRRLKARMEAERLPRGRDPTRHTKLGPGGLSDVEWTVQLLQLRHAAAEPGLRCTGTLPALAAAEAAGLLTPADATALRDAWTLATRVRNAAMLASGRPSDWLPADLRALRRVALVTGHASGGELVEDYLRVTRRARMVVDRVFFGE